MTSKKEEKKTIHRKGHNEGNIRQRKDGTYEARYIAGRTPDGKPIRKSIYGKKRGEVVKQLTKILNDINQGKYIEPSKQLLSDWADI